MIVVMVAVSTEMNGWLNGWLAEVGYLCSAPWSRELGDLATEILHSSTGEQQHALYDASRVDQELGTGRYVGSAPSISIALDSRRRAVCAHSVSRVRDRGTR